MKNRGKPKIMFIFLAQGLIFRSESRWQQTAKNYKKSESELSNYSCLYILYVISMEIEAKILLWVRYSSTP